MTDDIVVSGIQTNNLKNISIKIQKKAINLIIGPSGSGKSSLAYETIAQLGLHELGAMYSDEINEPEYKVQSFSNMVVTIPIKQLNTNNNVRSTIGTYFSLNPCLAKIYSSLLKIPYDYFVLNKSENVCPECLGVGYKKLLDQNKIIDYSKTIDQVPFKCWKKNKDFYKQILSDFCHENRINEHVKFKQLSEENRNKLLFGQSITKFRIKYKVTNHQVSRTTYYYGPMTGIPMLKSFSPSNEFYSDIKCKCCNGEKFERNHKTKKICGISIGEVLLLSFEELVNWIKNIRKNYDCQNIEFSLNQLENFSKKAIELNLGYLFINRNIPSLSGGELQRLRLIQVFSSQLSDLLIVLDEPLAGLSGLEKNIVYQNIVDLSRKHTILLVDHHDIFFNIAKTIYALGEGGGKKGGNLIDYKKYISHQREEFKFEPLPFDSNEKIKINSNVYSYKGVNISIVPKRLNIISGHSGIGKSTLLREYLPQYFDNYLYVNQKPINGNIKSTVSTLLDISLKIISIYAKKFKKKINFFSNLAGADGACRSCNGTGILTFGSQAQSQIKIECKDCKGTGFDKSLNKYKIEGLSLIDICKLTVDEAIDFFKNKDKRIYETLKLTQSLLLGHIVLGEKTSNLSGGENIRIKLVKALFTNQLVIGIDEPFKGLNNEEIYTVVKALSKLTLDNKTIIVVDHEESSFKYFSKHIVLKNKNGLLTE